MDPVARQYEAYPYPTRDPKEEAKRLVTGSPSHPVEIDHFVFGGVRDWSAPIRILVAGGGTGDALVMMAQLLKTRGTPAEIHYIDLSKASRAVAEARLDARGIEGVQFHTGDLLTAPELGPFDYIDCCGVLHHLTNPDEGFEALAKALSPDGGLGAMVYAPYGRFGVYPLQEAFAAAFGELEPEAKVAAARGALERLPLSHPFRRNSMVTDHMSDDAGLYDLLLHAKDQPFTAPQVIEALEKAGLALSSFAEPIRYDPTLYLGQAGLEASMAALDKMSLAEQVGLAEQLAGNIKSHVFYATPSARAYSPPDALSPALTPVIHKAPARSLANAIQKNGTLRFVADGMTLERPVDKKVAPLIAAMDGKTTLETLQRRTGLDWLAFAQNFGPTLRALEGFNVMRYSRFEMK